MKYILGIVFCSTIFTGTLFAQSIERDVYNSSGSVAQAGGITLTSNLGEPLTAYYFQTGVGRILTQGFIQPDGKDLTASISETGNPGMGLSIWPNPTAEGITVTFAAAVSDVYTASVYDMAGKCVRRETLCTGCTTHSLALADLADGMYVLRVTGSEATQDFKFIKTAH